MTDNEIYNIIDNHLDFFHSNSIFNYIGRAIGWAIVKGIKWLVDLCQSLFSITIGLVDFTQWTGVNDFLSQFNGLFKVLLGVSLIALGVMYVINWEKKPRPLQVAQNLLLGFFFITSSMMVLNQINTVLINGTTAVMDTYGGAGATSGDTIVRDNLYDLYYADEVMDNGLSDLASRDMPQYISLTSKDIAKIDYTEIVDTGSDSLKDSSKEILKKRIIYIHNGADNPGTALRDVTNDFFGVKWLGDGYYRYTFHFFTAIITMLAFILIYVVMSYKVVRYIYEIITGEFLGIIYSASITNSQKIIKIIECIKNAYVMILVSTICIKLFLLVQTYMNETDPFKSNGAVRCILILFSAFALADGPNIVEKVTGYDAGLQSGFGKVFAAYHAATAPIHAAAGVGGFAMQMKNQHNISEGISNMSNSVNQAANNMPGNNEDPKQTNMNQDINNNSAQSEHTGPPDNKNTSEQIGNETIQQTEDETVNTAAAGTAATEVGANENAQDQDTNDSNNTPPDYSENNDPNEHRNEGMDAYVNDAVDEFDNSNATEENPMPTINTEYEGKMDQLPNPNNNENMPETIDSPQNVPVNRRNPEDLSMEESGGFSPEGISINMPNETDHSKINQESKSVSDQDNGIGKTGNIATPENRIHESMEIDDKDRPTTMEDLE